MRFIALLLSGVSCLCAETITSASVTCPDGSAGATRSDDASVNVALDCGAVSPAAAATANSGNLFAKVSADGNASASFDDAYFIPGQGTGFVAYLFDLSYSGSANGGVPTAQFTVTVGGKPVLQSSAQVTAPADVSADGQSTYSGTLAYRNGTWLAPIAFGQWFTVTGDLAAAADSPGSAITAQATLASVLVYDHAGNLLPAADPVAAASAPIPEPQTLSLTALGLMALVCGARGRRRVLR